MFWQSALPASEPIVVEVPVIVEVPVVVETPVVEVPTKPEPGTDTDSDGLTDVEEELYGTDYRNPDTDADSFLDGNEVFHRYDPLGYSPQTLLDTGRVSIFEPSDELFSVYYPKVWKTAITSGGVIFNTNDTAKIEISKQAKQTPCESLSVWYKREVAPNSMADDLQESMTKVGYLSLMSNNELRAYVDGEGGYVYVFTYDLVDEIKIEYLNTFQMMVNSLTVLDIKQQCD